MKIEILLCENCMKGCGIPYNSCDGGTIFEQPCMYCGEHDYLRNVTLDSEQNPVLFPLMEKSRRQGIHRRPTIVCLCGSTRFKDAFDEANYRETMTGKIVLSVGFYMHASGNRHGEHIGATHADKIALDELHKRKIDLADEVLILNVGGYIGSSTYSEYIYAKDKEKAIRWLEPGNVRKCPECDEVMYNTDKNSYSCGKH